MRSHVMETVVVGQEGPACVLGVCVCTQALG